MEFCRRRTSCQHSALKRLTHLSKNQANKSALVCVSLSVLLAAIELEPKELNNIEVAFLGCQIRPDNLSSGHRPE